MTQQADLLSARTMPGSRMGNATSVVLDRYRVVAVWEMGKSDDPRRIPSRLSVAGPSAAGTTLNGKPIGSAS